MKKYLRSSSVSLLVLAFSFSVSWVAVSSVLAVKPRSKDFISCLKSNSNNVSSISQLIFTPANASFLPIWRVGMDNIWFDKPSTPRPSVIVTPVDEMQIQKALYCAKNHGYEIRIRGGGHDVEALSSTADVPFVMIYLTHMRSVEVDVANRTAWVQGGATIGEVYYAITQKSDTLYFSGGVCTGIGVGGHIGGGGYGNMMRKHGIAADNVVDVRFMNVNGKILDRKSMGKDLFWAIRGGGASSFGIVLAWKLRLVRVPKKVTVFMLPKTLEDGATEIFHKYQYVAPVMDKNLHIRTLMFGRYVGNSTKKTVVLTFQGVYLGKTDALLRLMNEYLPELGVTRESCQRVKMLQSTLMFWGLSSSTPLEIVMNRTAIPKVSAKSKVDYVRTPIPISGLKKIWKKILENDGSEFLGTNPFGGRMAEVSETATPYPHRGGVLYQFFTNVNFTYDRPSLDPPRTSLERLSWLRSLQKLLTPYVSMNPREAYYNYNDLDLGVGSANYEEASVWGERYFKRHNFKKLIRIKAKVDPENFLRHPQSIPVF